MMRLLLSLISRNALSQLVGKIVHIPLPPPLARWSIEVFARMYNINLQEAEKSTREYASIGDFFIRKLKSGVRPIAGTPIVHPSDSVISQVGWMSGGTLIQAKGKTYAASELLQDQKLAKQMSDGFFLTYYLCPTDYHRVHSPVDGEVVLVRHIPGDLWPVNEWSVNAISNLFPINERVVLEIQTEMGRVALVFVGATNVGKISISFEPRVSTNEFNKRGISEFSYAQPIKIKKVQELGIFHMGSTVVMLYEKSLLEAVFPKEISQKSNADSAGLVSALHLKSVKMGEALGL